jgi:hypothetical protein
MLLSALLLFLGDFREPTTGVSFIVFFGEFLALCFALGFVSLLDIESLIDVVSESESDSLAVLFDRWAINQSMSSFWSFRKTTFIFFSGCFW